MKGKIFNAQEVQAIIAGNKTQFREVIRKEVKPDLELINTGEHCGYAFHGLYCAKTGKDILDICPYQVGQKIFVKESVSYRSHYYFDLNNTHHYGAWKKIKAQHMKQEHSRLTLQIKEIRVERLADISEEDAIKEGFECGTNIELSKLKFAEFWNATHKKPEEKWGANPFVWCVSFEVVK